MTPNRLCFVRDVGTLLEQIQAGVAAGTGHQLARHGIDDREQLVGIVQVSAGIAERVIELQQRARTEHLCDAEERIGNGLRFARTSADRLRRCRRLLLRVVEDGRAILIVRLAARGGSAANGVGTPPTGSTESAAKASPAESVVLRLLNSRAMFALTPRWR